MRCGTRGLLQLRHAETFLGFFAWWERREFLRAFDERLRGTAIMKLLKENDYARVSFFLKEGNSLIDSFSNQA
jgi:hypothetical protein